MHGLVLFLLGEVGGFFQGCAAVPYHVRWEDGGRLRVRGLFGLHLAQAVLEQLPERSGLPPAVGSTCFESLDSDLVQASLRVHSFGTPIFETQNELQANADSRLRLCWRNPSHCWAAVAKMEYIDVAAALASEEDDLSGSGSATFLLLMSPACRPAAESALLAVRLLERDASSDAATSGAEGVAEAEAFQRLVVVEVLLQELQPGLFEQPRVHRQLARWTPFDPDGEPYPEEDVEGFTQHCHRAAVGPTDTRALWHQIFGRVLCSPSVVSRPEDFTGFAEGLKIYIQPLPSLVNADRLVVASLVRLAYNYTCDAGIFLCSEDRWDGSWSTWRQYIGEVALLQKFLTAPPEVLVTNASEADLILVPLLSQFLSNWWIFKQAARGCPRELLKYLKHMDHGRPQEPSRQTHGLSQADQASFNDAMRRSIFCPMGPGDTPHRHKFYHAILAGCIPVLFDFFMTFQWDGSQPDAFTAIMQRIGRFVRKQPQIR
eukprot:g337.t1